MMLLFVPSALEVIDLLVLTRTWATTASELQGFYYCSTKCWPKVR